MGIDVRAVSEFGLEFGMEVSVKAGSKSRLSGVGLSLVWVLFSSVLLVMESFVDLVNCSNFSRRSAIRLLRRNGFTSAASVGMGCKL